MTRMAAEVLELPIVIPRREVLRYLGYPRDKRPAPRVLERIEALETEAAELVKGRGAFVLAGREEAASVGMPKPADRVAFGVCTIGLGLEQREAQLSAEDDPLGGLILDAFGSAAAEEAAEALHARICAAVQHDHLRAGRRVSPGYGRWDVIRQHDLLAHLPTDVVGVRLTPSSMMIPRKSVSFAVPLEPPGQVNARAHCASCEMTDCLYRRSEPAAAESEETKRR